MCVRMHACSAVCFATRFCYDLGPLSIALVLVDDRIRGQEESRVWQLSRLLASTTRSVAEKDVQEVSCPHNVTYQDVVELPMCLVHSSYFPV